ncbi:MAG TPA: Arm DNA-binding domain-containing protein, partial [Marinagarivorans sp.]
MGKLTAKQVIAYSKADPKKYSDGESLYFCVRKQGSPYWMIRYTTAKGRREATLGQFPLMSLADARIAAAYFRKEVRDGIDPLLEKQKIELPDIETVDQLFHDWDRTDLRAPLKMHFLRDSGVTGFCSSAVCSCTALIKYILYRCKAGLPHVLCISSV